jgi:hypothetical protein
VVYHVRGREARKPSLPIPLIYRKRISPYEVYQNGVLEWIELIPKKFCGHRFIEK